MIKKVTSTPCTFLVFVLFARFADIKRYKENTANYVLAEKFYYIEYIQQQQKNKKKKRTEYRMKFEYS